MALPGSSPEGEGGADHQATEEDRKFTGATMGEVGAGRKKIFLRANTKLSVFLFSFA